MRLHLAHAHFFGPVREWREAIGGGAVRRGFDFQKINLPVEPEMICHWFAADERYGCDGVRAFAELSKQKRVGTDSQRLVLAFLRTQNHLPV